VVTILKIVFIITESDSNTGAYYVKLNARFRAALFVLDIRCVSTQNASSFS